MRFFLLIIVLFSTELFSQNGSIKLFFEDNVGRRDSVELGANNTATLGIDTSFNEVDVYGTPFDSLDARVIQRDSINFNCLNSSADNQGLNLYFPDNIDSKIDYRPFFVDWNGVGFGVVNDNFEILINAVEYPVKVSADFSDVVGSMIGGGWSKLYLLDGNCNDYDSKELATHLQDSLFILTDSSFNTIVVRFQIHVGIEDYNQPKLSFQLFPNPSQGNITLKFNSFITGEISISDITGQQVFTDDIHHEKYYQTSLNLPSGLYVLHVQTKSNRLTKKLLIKN